MHVADQELPFLARHFHGGVLAIRLAAGACATVDERAGVTWVVQDLKDSTMLRLAPQQFALLVARTYTTRKPKPLLAEEADGLHGRAGTLKGVKHQTYGGPDFLVGVEPYAPVRQIDQANRRSHLQFAAASFVEHTAAHARLQEMQFRLTEFSLQAEKEPVIKSGGIVKAIFIEDQSAGDGTQLDQ